MKKEVCLDSETIVESKKLSDIWELKNFECVQLDATSSYECFLTVPQTAFPDDLIGWLLDGRRESVSRIPSVKDLQTCGYDIAPLKKLGLGYDEIVTIRHLMRIRGCTIIRDTARHVAKANKAIQECSFQVRKLRNIGIECKTGAFSF